MTNVSLMVAENLSPFAPALWGRLLADLPEALHPGILVFRRWEDRQASLLARLMLAARFGRAAPTQMRRDSYGRPGLDGSEFNISHADGVVVLATASERVGVDVERIRPVVLDDYGSALSDDELRRLESSPERDRAFFALWTAKEAAVKADGRGMTIPLAGVTIVDGVALIDGARWRLTPVPLGPEFMCHVALRGGRDTPAAVVKVDVFPLPGEK
ncbi:MAG TPA: 4'-phosphopantetheinyl transferase superfamily protein [Candidatus Ozemobacteraceae bacterium]|nr:4'-phosphopantetheinyl transferase superfamily protein [Candidatus Ozemobacteraceae bacterium]